MAINFKAIAERLRAESLRYLQEWLPAGKKRGREYVVGDLQGGAGESLSINIDTGVWKDFASGKGGADLISLYAAINGIKQGEAAKQFSTGGRDEMAEDVYLPGNEAKNIPAHTKYGAYTKIWEYFHADGKLAGYICRFDPPNERKQIIPRTCWKRHDGTAYWKWKKWPTISPLYRLPDLLSRTDAKVLIVEGEKAADAAQILLKDWVVVSWQGGVENIKHTDWSPLKGRYCWMWPDADEPGRIAATGIKKILPDMHIVKLPEGIPDGWDLADAMYGFPVLDFLREGDELIVKKQVPTVSAENVALVLTHLDPLNNTRPLATLANMRDLLNYYNITCRYNIISKRIEVVVPDETFSVENADEASMACIYSRLKEWKIPVDGYGMYLMRIADENQYNPVLNWIRSHPWDRISRLPEFYDTITSSEHEAKELLIRRWLITAVCMAMYNGIDGAGCLVLQGPQNLGKTWWVKKLVPEEIRESVIRTDADVDPKDKDSVSQVISYWICELGEIGATFNKADLQSIKTFITRDHDTMRRPYGIGDKRYPRRTALVASVDQHIFLHDTAGNRRFWTIPCSAINSYHEIDMQQVFAEVMCLITEQGESWRLAPDELAHVTRINQEHQQVEPIHEMINARFNLREQPYGVYFTATQIADILGYKPVTQKETRTISKYLRDARVLPTKDGHGNRVYNIARL